MKNISSKNILFILFLYAILKIIFSILNISFYFNIISSFISILFITYIIIHNHFYYSISYKSKKYLYTIIFTYTIFYIIYFYIGLKIGFTKSPYNHQIISIIKNIFIEILPIISLEIVRNIFIINNKKSKLSLIIITILIILIEINYNTLFNLIPYKEDIFKYICSTILPLIATNFLYTYISLYSTYIITLTLSLLEKLPLLLLPLFISSNWFLLGSISLIKIITLYIIFKYLFLSKKNKIFKKKKTIFAILEYAFTLFFVTCLVCFMIGKFKYEPIAILSNSMSPTYERGDIIIIEKKDLKELENLPINTIIAYTYYDKIVAHRIISIVNKENKIQYITKGDKNNIEDLKSVPIDKIKGIYKFHIKYIGFPSIWLKECLNN